MITSTWRTRVLTLALGIMVVGGLLTPVAAAPPAVPPPDCPSALPIDQVTQGLVADGWTVSQGMTPEPFSAEVLGVMPDGVGPGRDLIIVEASSPAITDAGGIWYGMSGSPVYYNDQLLGVVAYALSWGPSPIAGLTAGEDITNILDYPEASTTTASRSTRVRLTRAMARRVAAATGAPADEADTLTPLKAPLSVSGMSPRAMQRLRKVITRENLPFRAYAGASAPAPSSAALAPAPTAGQSFAAALSYGDVTLAGVGTLSVSCPDKGVAFGHPFFSWPAGPVTLGANHANALTVVHDPIGGSYKLANVGDAVGIVDQDRFSGIRALFGETPTTIPITSTVTATDWNRTREGQTDVVSTDWTAYVAFGHMLSNIDFTFDQIGPGSSVGSFIVKGERESGAPFVLARNNMYSSDFDISYESVSELDRVLYSLFNNGYEDITFTEIDVDVDVERTVRILSLRKVMISKNGGPYRSVNELSVRPGDRLGVRAVLDPSDGDVNEKLDFAFRVPTDVRRSGFISVSGGAREFYFDSEECFYSDSCAQSDGNGFSDLLAKLQNAATNDQLNTKMRFGRRLISNQKMLLGKVVRGSHRIYLNVNTGGGGSGGTPVYEKG
jgi:SpoIVB peptidase S55